MFDVLVRTVKPVLNVEPGDIYLWDGSVYDKGLILKLVIKHEDISFLREQLIAQEHGSHFFSTLSANPKLTAAIFEHVNGETLWDSFSKLYSVEQLFSIQNGLVEGADETKWWVADFVDSLQETVDSMPTVTPVTLDAIGKMGYESDTILDEIFGSSSVIDVVDNSSDAVKEENIVEDDKVISPSEETDSVTSEVEPDMEDEILSVYGLSKSQRDGNKLQEEEEEDMAEETLSNQEAWDAIAMLESLDKEEALKVVLGGLRTLVVNGELGAFTHLVFPMYEML